MSVTSPAIEGMSRARCANARWRSGGESAPRGCRELRADAQGRAEQHGELAYLLEPDLKEAYGGLREATNLRAHRRVVVGRRSTIGVAAGARRPARRARRPAPRATGRAADRLLLQEQDAVASSVRISLTPTHCCARCARRVERWRTPTMSPGTAWSGPCANLDGACWADASWTKSRGNGVRSAEGVVELDGEAVLGARRRPGPAMPASACARRRRRRRTVWSSRLPCSNAFADAQVGPACPVAA